MEVIDGRLWLRGPGFVHRLRVHSGMILHEGVLYVYAGEGVLHTKHGVFVPVGPETFPYRIIEDRLWQVEPWMKGQVFENGKSHLLGSMVRTSIGRVW